MIHIVTAANRSFYEECLERRDGREINAYDNDDTVYLVALEDERIVGGHRLYPTVKPTMLGEAFPHLASVRGLPEDLSIWEWSRYFVVNDRCDGKLDLALMAAVQELCLDEGITEVSSVIEMWSLPRFQDAGFVVQPLGLPALVGGEWTMAALIEISTRTLDCVKEKAGIQGSALVRRGPQPPLIDHRLIERRRVIGERP